MQPGQPNPTADITAAAPHEELVRVVERALTELEEGGPPDERLLAQTAGPETRAVPGWLSAIIQSAIRLFGPWLADALRRLLDMIVPPAFAAEPKPGGPASPGPQEPRPGPHDPKPPPPPPRP